MNKYNLKIVKSRKLRGFEQLYSEAGFANHASTLITPNYRISNIEIEAFFFQLKLSENFETVSTIVASRKLKRFEHSQLELKFETPGANPDSIPLLGRFFNFGEISTELKVKNRKTFSNIAIYDIA